MALVLNGIDSDTISVKKKNIELVTNLAEELIINKVRVENLKNSLTKVADVKILEHELYIISEIQDAVKRLSLSELSTLAESIEEGVRQENLNKKDPAQVAIQGMDIEVEHTIFEYLHLILGNLIKNYFEDEDAFNGSHANALSVKAHSDGKTLTVLLETTNNSTRCDAACRVLSKRQVDLVTLSDEQLSEFLTGIKNLTQMDRLKLMKPTLAAINGSLIFEPISSEIRRVTICIPLLTAVMKGMLVTVGSHTMALPSDFIEAIVMPKNLLNFEENKNHGQVIYLDKIIPMMDLGELMGIAEESSETTILIVSANGSRIALRVDSVIDQTDLVIKPKHSILSNIIEVKGTTILGDGQVTMVLDIPAIIKSKAR